ncbi:DUF1598 domain-containing protein [Roseimaritima sediminicola]|uniref:DUF1598 domain-containing protein n=1 Tax=Roseimaritima sediminicola TaxID=2662066 RepID=UPI0012983B8E|nr:DUF1598 domain-containing protein [Roseimaritima sediminicola]
MVPSRLWCVLVISLISLDTGTWSAGAQDAAPETGGRAVAVPHAAADVTSGPQVRPGAGVAGGGTVADFTQLMELIQRTVAPETWEQLGGPSTMAPYAGGIVVDAKGLVKDIEVDPHSVSVDAIAGLLSGDGAATDEPSWKAASPMRCVSLKRMAAEWRRRQILGWPPTESLYNLGGLSRVEYVVIDRNGVDILLAGPVGGIDSSGGWPRDRKTGAATLQLPAVAAVVRSAVQEQPFGCTIDPSDQGIARSLQTAAAIRSDAIPIADAAQAMQQALGQQEVTVFGTAGDGPLAWMLVEADRHMKQLALGKHPMPTGVPNYLDVITQTIQQGPPDGQLLRLWFTSQPVKIRSDSRREVFQLSGRGLRLVSEDQRPDALGGRHAAKVDLRSRQFVKEFNRSFPAIAQRYPIYSVLEGVYHVAAIAELARHQLGTAAFEQVLGGLAVDANGHLAELPAPRVVESIAVMHTVRHRNTRHHVIVASGGVSVDPASVWTGKIETYDSLASARPDDRFRPAGRHQWWWDAAP